MTLPTYAEVMDLPVIYSGVVPRDAGAPRIHMTVRDYFAEGSEAVLTLCRQLGLDEDYASRRGALPVTAEHHLAYFGELFEGERFSVHGRLLDRSAKALHMMAFVVDQERQALASTLEAVFVHVDAGTRRVVPFPPDIAERADRLLATSQHLSWAAPLCGVMGVRK